MNYMGSNKKNSKYILPIIQKYIDDNNIMEFYDVFCGGANICDKIKNTKIIASDLSPTLIALHKQAQEDFSKIPVENSKEIWDITYGEWKKLKSFNFKILNKTNFPLCEIGAMEWYGSYSNGGFGRGYRANKERNFYLEAYKSHKAQSENSIYKNIDFVCCDYGELKIKKNSLIYCNPPNLNCKPYGVDRLFDYNKFYTWLKNKSKNNPIFVSEKFLPNDFNKYIIWEEDKLKDNEKLWLIDNRGVK